MTVSKALVNAIDLVQVFLKESGFDETWKEFQRELDGQKASALGSALSKKEPVPLPSLLQLVQEHLDKRVVERDLEYGLVELIAKEDC